MSESFIQAAETAELFRSKSSDFSEPAFRSSKSAGANPVRLAKICAAWELACVAFHWENHPLSTIITSYQASIGGRYHEDFVKIAVAERVAEKSKRSIMDMV